MSITRRWRKAGKVQWDDHPVIINYEKARVNRIVQIWRFIKG